MQGSTTRSLVRSCPAYAAKFSRQVKTRNKTRNILLCVLCAGKINCDMVDKNYSTPRAGIQSSCILPSVSINLIASTFLVFFVNSFVCIPLLLPSHSHHPQKFMRAQTPLWVCVRAPRSHRKGCHPSPPTWREFYISNSDDERLGCWSAHLQHSYATISPPSQRNPIRTPKHEYYAGCY